MAAASAQEPLRAKQISIQFSFPTECKETRCTLQSKVIIIITIIICSNSSSIASPVLVIFLKTVFILHNIIFSFFPSNFKQYSIIYVLQSCVYCMCIFYFFFKKIRIKAGMSLACFVFVSLSFCRFSLHSPKALRHEKRAQTQADKFQCYPYIHTP